MSVRAETVLSAYGGETPALHPRQSGGYGSSFSQEAGRLVTFVSWSLSLTTFSTKLSEPLAFARGHGVVYEPSISCFLS